MDRFCIGEKVVVINSGVSLRIAGRMAYKMGITNFRKDEYPDPSKLYTVVGHEACQNHRLAVGIVDDEGRGYVIMEKGLKHAQIPPAHKCGCTYVEEEEYDG